MNNSVIVIKSFGCLIEDSLFAIAVDAVSVVNLLGVYVGAVV